MQLPTSPVDDPRDPRTVAVDVFHAVSRAMRGADDVVGLAVVALLSGGHLLVEGVPGTGKTLLAKSLANAIGGRFGRVQCTPDLLPGRRHRHVGVQPGDRRLGVPRRAGVRERPPRRRGQPRVAPHPGRAARADGGAPGHDRRRDAPAARRRSSSSRPRIPFGHAGTFPLPDSQLDRFAMVCTIGRPGRDAEREILERRRRRRRARRHRRRHHARGARRRDGRGAPRALRALGARLRARRRRRDPEPSRRRARRVAAREPQPVARGAGARDGDGSRLRVARRRQGGRCPRRSRTASCSRAASTSRPARA